MCRRTGETMAANHELTDRTPLRLKRHDRQVRRSGTGRRNERISGWSAMGGSHPLAGRVGAWPAVLAVTAVTVAAAEAVARAGAR
jgi:hypothetical protein